MGLYTEHQLAPRHRAGRKSLANINAAPDMGRVLQLSLKLMLMPRMPRDLQACENLGSACLN